MSRPNSRDVRIVDFTEASCLCRLHFSVLLILACVQSQGCGSGEHGIEDVWTSDSTASDVDASDVPFDDVTTGSAFGIFAGFTREFGDYEAAARIDHAEYLDWAGEQYRALGAYWTRSNLQLVWDVVEPIMGGGYEWDHEMGTDEAFGAASVAPAPRPMVRMAPAVV
jgi:hypothetical protein